jgi:hypothetical protein
MIYFLTPTKSGLIQFTRWKGIKMPAEYEAMRDKFMRQGLSKARAQEKAARIYNSRHPDAPVTGKSHGKKRR